MKFVFQDDTIVPTAVERLVGALQGDRGAVFAFSRREIRHFGPNQHRLPLMDDFYSNLLGAFYRSFDGRLSGVEVHGEKVILRGTVRSSAEKQEAERIAWSAPGVHSVDNQIRISL